MLDKTLTPNTFEESLYFESLTAFKANPDSSKPPFTVMMPPPNVTGSLHLGHALTYTLQDVLIRFKRALGFDSLWQPGVDHAGIATQMVVERQLLEKNIKKQDLGRDKFLEKVWEWKEYSGNTIVQQQKRLRISADWGRSRFTMDEGLSKAVTEVFVQLYKNGLIYRDKRLVNWDTKMLTAVSDLEVINKEEKKPFWHIRYPLADNQQENIVIATTRPETMFGDTAIAVHPDDERYKHLIGKMVVIPLTKRLIPIIADEYCDQEKGSGAVKITPAHDFNDFEVGKRHQLERINILNSDGCLNEIAPQEFQGLYFSDARKAVVQKLEELNCIEKIEESIGAVPYGERSNTEIQPYLTDQWFVDAKTLAEPALKAVQEGYIQFVPKHWENTYFEWLNNIQPWCISRQIWWGHQIPAWFSDSGDVFVETSEESAYATARAKLGDDVVLTRETDVLDTWFSSALWPFTTLGWPEETAALNRYFPTDVLITGFDIIFFWVARMIMMALYFKKAVPFKTVYIHGLIRDEKGQKMSKSKGNIIDPLELLDKYGSDAVRFTLAASAVPGRDIKLAENRIEGYRNFCTKIWNAARFLEMNGCLYTKDFKPTTAQHPINRWLIDHISDVRANIEKHLEDYRFDLIAQDLYQSFWYSFCDYYLESLKVLQQGTFAEESKQTAMWGFFQYLSLMHPIMPSITSYLTKYFSMHTCLTEHVLEPITNNTQDLKTNDVWRLVEEVRSIKGLLNLSGGIILDAYIKGDTNAFSEFSDVFCAMARLTPLKPWFDTPPPKDSLPCIAGEFTVYVVFGSAIDAAQAKTLLTQKHTTLEKEQQHLSKKLTNDAYKNAKPEQWAEDNTLCMAKTLELQKLKSFINVL